MASPLGTPGSNRRPERALPVRSWTASSGRALASRGPSPPDNLCPGKHTPVRTRVRITKTTPPTDKNATPATGRLDAMHPATRTVVDVLTQRPTSTVRWSSWTSERPPRRPLRPHCDCDVGAIANSLVFIADPALRNGRRGEPVLVLTSGAHRVDTTASLASPGRTATARRSRIRPPDTPARASAEWRRSVIRPDCARSSTSTWPATPWCGLRPATRTRCSPPRSTNWSASPAVRRPR